MSKTWKEAYSPSWRVINNWSCADKGLASLVGAPSEVPGSFDCARNELTSLKGAPSYVGGYFDCSSNELTSLEGVPSHIGGRFFCRNNQLTSLKDIHLQIKHIGKFAHFGANEIRSHILGLLLIDGLLSISLSDDRKAQDIINKYLPSKGMESVLLAQEELIIAGLEEYAQL